MKKKITKLLSVLLAFAVFMCSAPIETEAAKANNGSWGEYENTSNEYTYCDFSPFVIGSGYDGSEASPYIISTSEQLAALAALVNQYEAGNNVELNGINIGTATATNFEGKYIKLAADIDLSAHEWVPIGLGSTNAYISTNTFQGNFDGAGHTVSGMKIGTKDTANTTYGYAGLFGYVQGGYVKNLAVNGVVNVSISSNAYAGGIVGYAKGSSITSSITIENCGSSVSVTASGSNACAGGIAGRVEGLNSRIANSYNTGAVTATKNAGGIAGYAYTVTITNSYNTGAVTADTNAGGIAGGISAGAITNCYNASALTATNAGGIAGTVSSNPPDTTNCVWLYDNGVGVSASKGSGDDLNTSNCASATEAQMKALAGTGTGTPIITIAGTSYYALVDLLNSWVKDNDGCAAWSNLQDGYPVHGFTWGKVELNDSEYVYAYADFSPFASGSGYDGSEANPYLISTPAQLAALAALVNQYEAGNNVELNGINIGTATATNFAGKYIKLAANIDLSAHEWVPIGLGSTNAFKGNFDGAGHTVSGMKIGTLDIVHEYAGLFGYMSAGYIKNLNVNGAVKATKNENIYAGGIVGYAGGSSITIENCGSSVSVTASGSNAYAGGIAGYASNVNITNSFNKGAVTADTNAGGIAGGISGGTIANCYSASAVTATNAGGIAGIVDIAPTATNCVWLYDDGLGVAASKGHGNNINLNNCTYATEIQMTSPAGTNEGNAITGTSYYALIDFLNAYANENKLAPWHVHEGEYPVLGEEKFSYKENPEIAEIHEESCVCGYTTVTEPHDYVNGVCEKCKKIDASLEATNLTLEGNIGLNFYFEINSELMAEENGAKVRFTLADGRVIEIPLQNYKATNTTYKVGTTLYVYTCEVSSKQMADQIKVQVIVGENAGKEYSHSVVEYAEKLLANEENKPQYAAAASLIEAMLHYGANAQLCFGYNTKNLANKNLAAQDLSGVTVETFAPHKASGMEIAGIGKFESANLLLESETTLNVYFKPAAGVTADMLTFTVGGESVTPTEHGEYLVISITDIKASELDSKFTINVTKNGTENREFTCSVYSYCYSVLNAPEGTYKTELINTLKALYLYNGAADGYKNS